MPNFHPGEVRLLLQNEHLEGAIIGLHFTTYQELDSSTVLIFETNILRVSPVKGAISFTFGVRPQPVEFPGHASHLIHGVNPSQFGEAQ